MTKLWRPPIRPDELYHYGVKGMKWRKGKGNRRVKSANGDDTGTYENPVMKDVIRTARKEEGYHTPGGFTVSATFNSKRYGPTREVGRIKKAKKNKYNTAAYTYTYKSTNLNKKRKKKKVESLNRYR